MSIWLVLQGMRPRQWAKNVFVFAPLLFALRLTDGHSVLGSLVAVALFCLASGAVYLVNDIVDREADRAHPEKRHRPIASGRLAVPLAGGAAVVAVVFAVGLAAAWQVYLAAVIAAFFLLNLAYSFWLKRIPIVDVLVISAGFILRVVGGALAIEVPISLWILVCTFLLSLYLGLGKRLHELIGLGESNRTTRAALRGYRIRPTRLLFRTVGLLAVVAFACYTLSPRAAENFGTIGLIFTVPFVVLGLWRFALLAEAGHRSSSPTEALLSDPPVLVSALLWGVSATAIIYLPRLL
jgi:decaprenyl-phosphate phosphoribosyltransferase